MKPLWEYFFQGLRRGYSQGRYYYLPPEASQLGAVLGNNAMSTMDQDERTAGTQSAPEAAAAPLQDAGADIMAGSSGGPPGGDAHGDGTAAPPAPAQELPARGPYAGRREVTGWDGTYESAVEAGIITRPPPLSWNRWQQWRKSDEGAAPTVQADGHGRDSRHEAVIYARVMRLWYGANYREAARQFTAEHPDWRPPPPVEEEALSLIHI